MRYPKRHRIIAAVVILLATVHSSNANDMAPLNLIPVPKKVVRQEGNISLPASTQIHVEDEGLLPLAKVLSHNIYMQTGVKLNPSKERSAECRIILRLNRKLDSESYLLSIDDVIEISGGDYRGVVWGTATLSQLLTCSDEKIRVPRLRIEDAPDYEFRSVMLDLARRWHPIDTVKQTIDLLSTYKINYMHLHLSDTQSCVYTSRVLPKLATPKAYSWMEMKELVEYADDRGVTIIPEIDVPGHSSSWVGKMPEMFGTTDPESGESRPLGIVNMANEQAYEALDLLVGELSKVFASSPYIHIGTDETGAGGLIKLPEYRPYCEKHGLAEALNGKAHELFLHFIQRMNEIVRKHGKQAIAWNDFGGAKTPNVAIPTNLTTMYWVGSVQAMAKRGYPIINCCRLPLYIVPPQQSAPEDHRIYDWNARTFANWNNPNPIVLPETVPIKGAQICFWEQRYNEVIPILRSRVPVFAERLWHEKAGRSLADLRQRHQHTDRVTQNVILPVRFQVHGLIDEHGVDFDQSLTVKMTSSVPGTIRYALSKEWEKFPDATSSIARDAIKLNDTMTVSAQLYDHKGEPIGGIKQLRFRKMIPAYRYRMFGPTPEQGWRTMPDFKDLKVLQTGMMGLMDDDRGAQINRAMFAGLNPHGHVDVRIHNVYNPFTLELTGQMKFPIDGEYTFKLKSRHGLSELHSGNHIIVGAKVPGREYVVKGWIRAGTYPLRIKHFYRITQNELNIWMKGPEDEKFRPFESFVLPVSKWIDMGELSQLPRNCKFIDPVRLANANLAMDKPAMASSWQGNWLPANAVDGIPDNTNGWHADPYPQWLQVDLEKSYSISRVKLHTYYDGRRHYQYTIEASLDGNDWQQIVDMTKNVRPSTQGGFEHNFDPIQARYLRVNMLTNSVNPGVHINELMVFESKGTSK